MYLLHTYFKLTFILVLPPLNTVIIIILINDVDADDDEMMV